MAQTHERFTGQLAGPVVNWLVRDDIGPIGWFFTQEDADLFAVAWNEHEAKLSTLRARKCQVVGGRVVGDVVNGA